MKALGLPRLVLILLASSLMPLGVDAQQAEPGLAAAVSLLKQATKPQRDGSHNPMLLGLRRLEDPELLPLFRGLSQSPYLSMRVHGRLGSAALSPQRRIDLATVAEIDDQRELAQVLAAAIDDGLIDKKAMATLLTWQGLDLPLRQAIALRLVGMGEQVAIERFEPSLEIKLDDGVTANRLLQYAIASLIMAEQGDARGLASLNRLAQTKSDSYVAVLAQVFDAAMRYGFKSIGALAITIATDAEREYALRLLAVQCGMRLGTHGAARFWQSMFDNEQRIAQRIRLAMIALDSAVQHDPAVFDVLKNNGQWIGYIATAGRALASKNTNPSQAFEPLIATGQPLSVQWVVTYCQRDKPGHGPDLLEQVIRHHDAGPKQHRGKITHAAIDATAALCDTYPEQANKRLPLMLDTDSDDAGKQRQRRQIILFGIARANGRGIKPLAESIQPDRFNDFTTEALRLTIRARHGATLTEKEWQRVSDIVQGVGQLEPVMRLQLAWAYLKHKKAATQAISHALR